MTTKQLIKQYEIEMKTQLKNNQDFTMGLESNTLANDAFACTPECELAKSIIDFNHNVPASYRTKLECTLWNITYAEWCNQLKIGLKAKILYRIHTN